MVQIIARHHIAVKSYLQAGYLIDVDCKRLIYLTLHVFSQSWLTGKEEVRGVSGVSDIHHNPHPVGG
jgi:hypothetical protein